MIKVLFFGRFKDELGQSKVEVVATDLSIINDLRDTLINMHTPKWREVLTAANVIIAVNHKIVDAQYAVADWDEVAFYPPVTGG
ncbi:MAG: molybdopterin synthase sulfur carrier subunit [Pseudomonadales bacterium]|jgi:molybdopterin synthase sulfur carrier subunit